MKRRVLFVSLAVLILAVTTGAQERQRWPIPTYTVEFRSLEPGNFSIELDGYCKTPTGEVVKIPKYKHALPYTLYANADYQIHLKIRPNDRPYKIDVFYEFGDKVQRRGGVESRAGEGIVLNIEPYAEDKP